jgi:hypothetical protein
MYLSALWRVSARTHVDYAALATAQQAIAEATVVK